jgi:hypothetical protein
VRFGNAFRPELDENGAHFIDRDGILFRHVLNFLRTDCVFLGNRPEEYEVPARTLAGAGAALTRHPRSQALLKEAEYFMVSPLVKLLHTKLDKLRQTVDKENEMLAGAAAMVGTTPDVLKRRRSGAPERWTFTLDDSF